MQKRYIVKYDHHHTRYGVYDRAYSAMTWAHGKADAASRAARMNAVENINAHLNGAISAISTTLTGILTQERRQRFKAMREQLRDLRDTLPTCDDLHCEIQHDHSLPTLPRTMEA